MSIASLVTEGFVHDRVNGLVTEGFAAYTGLPEPPAAGYAYQTCTSLTFVGFSLAEGSVPAVALHDCFIASGVTSPAGYVVDVNGDGTFEIFSGGDTSRQSFQYSIYRVATNSIDGPATVWVNEVAPVWALLAPNIPFPTLTLGQTVSFNFVTSGSVASPSGDTLAFALLSGSLPPGLSLTGAGVLSGTTTAGGTFSYVIGATDAAGVTSPSPTFTTSVGSGPWESSSDDLTVSIITFTTALASWSAAVDVTITGYKLRYTPTVSGGSPTVIDVGNVTSFNITSLDPATAYLLEIAAYDSAGDLSAYAPGNVNFQTLSSSGASRMTPQYVFGPGVGWITPLTDSTGTAIANPAPVLVAAMQDVSLDLSAEVKELYGSKGYAVAIGRGKQKVGIKIKNGQVHGRLWNTMFFGQTLSAGIYDAYFDTTGTVLSSSTVTPTVPGSGTWGYDLGVRDINDLPLARVTGTPAAGQYAVASGVYTFAAADVSASKLVFISFNYTGTSTVAQKLVIQNQPMGYAPTFQFDLKIPYQGNVFNATFFNCMATKLGMSTKLDDFAYPEFDFSAFAPGSASVGELSWSQ